MKTKLILILSICVVLVPSQIRILAQTPEQILKDFSPAGISKRLGPNYKSYNLPPESLTPYYMPPIKQDVVNGKKFGRPYQIAGPWSSAGGGYSSTQGQVLYFTGHWKKFGLDRLNILEMANNTYLEAPVPPWWGGSGREPMSLGWPITQGVVPLQIVRGKAAWSNCGVILHSNGLLATAGTATGKGTNPWLRLPSNFQPTSIAITPRNEFVLVVGFDKIRKTGKIAVVAMTSDGSAGRAPGKSFSHEFPHPHPGLVNVAVFSGMKFLGYVDLPGIQYPTFVTATGDTMENGFRGPDGNVGLLKTVDLSKQTWRDSFAKGSNRTYATRSGFAIVLCKYENKAAIVDLQPLFDKTTTLYFTTGENYNKTRNQGAAPNQWPYAFSYDPSWKPVVLSVFAIYRPTVALATLGRKANLQRAFIASENGNLACYEPGALNNALPATARSLTYIKSINVGRNPTCLAYEGRSFRSFIAVSRGERKISWIEFQPDWQNIKIVRTLKDPRMVDPVYLELADTHGTDTQIITVTDFTGKVINYRYAPIIFYKPNKPGVFGMGRDGKAQFECGGVMSFPGHPVYVSSANVN